MLGLELMLIAITKTVKLFPGTGPVRGLHYRTRVQRYNLFPKNQKFFLNFSHFFEKSCIFPERIPQKAGIFVWLTIKNCLLCLL